MALERLLKGFKDFRTGYFREHHDLFEKLATEGQSPRILIIGCADARVDPGILTQTKPGDIFTVRNVAAMVPPAQFPPDTRHHGTSSAIEFAVRGLGVEHVVVLGHALCGGIGALVDGRDSIYASYDYLSTWTAIAQEVRDLAVNKLKGRSREEIARAVEQAAVLNSVSNLMGFRWIAEKVEAGALALHGWWFNMTEGQLYAFNPETAAFEAVHGIKVQPTVVKGTALSAIKPDQSIAAVAGKQAGLLVSLRLFGGRHVSSGGNEAFGPERPTARAGGGSHCQARRGDRDAIEHAGGGCRQGGDQCRSDILPDRRPAGSIGSRRQHEFGRAAMPPASSP